MRRFLVTSAIACAAPLLLAACGGSASADPRNEPPVVKVTAVRAGSATSRTFTGTVAARVQSDLAFRVPGKVVERLVDTGQAVVRGQALYRIDPVDLNLAAASQRQAVVAAHAQAAQTLADEARYRELQDQGVVSRSAYDQVKAAADAAQAQLRAAQAQAAVAGNASRYAVLISDTDGVVVDVLAEPGQVVAAGQVVVRVARAGNREAVVQLPETLRPALGSPATAVPFGERVAIPATLRVLSGSADPATRTFEARYALAQGSDQLPLGATVTVELPAEDTASAAGASEVPLAALFDPGTGPGVWLISGSPATATWRPVAVRQIGDDSMLVEGAFKPGDRVAALGAHLLREGQQVRIAGEPQATADEGAAQ